MPVKKALGREARGQSFIADGLDVPHLNVFITMRPVMRPDDTACAGFAPVGHHLWTFGSNHLLDSKPTDLLAIAKRQFHLRTPRRVLNEPVEDTSRICVESLHHPVPECLRRYLLARITRSDLLALLRIHAVLAAGARGQIGVAEAPALTPRRCRGRAAAGAPACCAGSPTLDKGLFDITRLARSSVVGPDALTEHQQVEGQQFSRTLHA